jgi:hypothetical protein
MGTPNPIAVTHKDRDPGSHTVETRVAVAYFFGFISATRHRGNIRD